MLNNIGWSGLVLILVALLIVFGPKKLPEIGKAFGNSLREFKKATQGLTDDAKQAFHEDTSSSPSLRSEATAQVVEPIELKTSELNTAESKSSSSNQQ